MYRVLFTGITPALPCASSPALPSPARAPPEEQRTKNQKKKHTRLHCWVRRRHDRSVAGAAGRLRHSRHRQRRVVTEAAGRMKCCSFLLGSAPRLPSRPPFIPATARLCLPQHSIAEAWCTLLMTQFSSIHHVRIPQ